MRGTLWHTMEIDRLTGKLDFMVPHQEGWVHSADCAAAGVLIMIADSLLHTGLSVS